MKVVILAGGFGTRISEYTETIPKPMVTIGDKPILWHIMKRYADFGYKEFYIALGYKSEIVKEYFANYKIKNADFTIDLNTGEIQYFSENTEDWKISLIFTGNNSMTGGRIKRLEKFLNKETFLLTYGDGLSDIDINELVKFHKNHGKMVTVSAVHPSARFGEIGLNGLDVESFKEKPQVNSGWINGGFFVIEPEFLDFINNDNTVLEKEPLEKVAKTGHLKAYLHKGFWQCMDTKRDMDILNDLWEKGDPPWTRN